MRRKMRKKRRRKYSNLVGKALRRKARGCFADLGVGRKVCGSRARRKGTKGRTEREERRENCYKMGTFSKCTSWRLCLKKTTRGLGLCMIKKLLIHVLTSSLTRNDNLELKEGCSRDRPTRHHFSMSMQAKLSCQSFY